MFKISTDNQLIGNTTKQLTPDSVTSKNKNVATKKLKIIQIADTTEAPLRAINRPNKRRLKEEKRGVKISNKYIKIS